MTTLPSLLKWKRPFGICLLIVMCIASLQFNQTFCQLLPRPMSVYTIPTDEVLATTECVRVDYSATLVDMPDARLDLLPLLLNFQFTFPAEFCAAYAAQFRSIAGTIRPILISHLFPKGS
jgi:hypothetical protein